MGERFVRIPRLTGNKISGPTGAPFETNTYLVHVAPFIGFALKRRMRFQAREQCDESALFVIWPEIR